MHRSSTASVLLQLDARPVAHVCHGLHLTDQPHGLPCSAGRMTSTVAAPASAVHHLAKAQSQLALRASRLA